MRSDQLCTTSRSSKRNSSTLPTISFSVIPGLAVECVSRGFSEAIDGISAVDISTVACFQGKTEAVTFFCGASATVVQACRIGPSKSIQERNHMIHWPFLYIYPFYLPKYFFLVFLLSSWLLYHQRYYITLSLKPRFSQVLSTWTTMSLQGSYLMPMLHVFVGYIFFWVRAIFFSLVQANMLVNM